MTDSIFTKIIKGEIPAYKIYEDSRTLAFLDIHPESPGHTLLIPKIQIDKFYDLSDDDLSNLIITAKKIAKQLEKNLKKRIILKIIGVDVPHTHIHLIPYSEHGDKNPKNPIDAELIAMAKKLKMS